MKIFKNKKKRRILIISLFITVIITNLIIVYYSSTTKEEPLIGTYIDGTYSETLPSKGSGYAVEKIVCDNNKTADWDYDKWGIKFSIWNNRSRCNIYFKSLEAITIANKRFYLDEFQKCPVMNSDGTLTVTSKEDTYGYLCKGKDNYGYSYYYRGNVINNYVKFGSWTNGLVYGYYSDSSSSYKEYDSMDKCQNASSYNKKCTVIRENNASMYWRIVRINGDGSIRLIYDGTSAYANNESSDDRQIGKSSFNRENDDNTYVGYMYGNEDGVVEQPIEKSSTTYQSSKTYYISKEYVYENGKFSMKDPIGVLGSAMTSDYVGYYTYNDTYADGSSWQLIYRITSVTPNSSGAEVGYKYLMYGTTSKDKAQKNIYSSDIKDYLDNWYASNIKYAPNNSNQYVRDNLFCNDRSLSDNAPSGYSNKGYGFEQTAYRLYNIGINSDIKIMLTCVQKNDSFTVNDTEKGNAALNYEVGLITADEAVLAGALPYASGGPYSDTKHRNRNYYLYNGQDYWTISPSYFDGSVAEEMFHSWVGDLSDGNSVNNKLGVRPVINLSSDVLRNGSGTASDPYHAD